MKIKRVTRTIIVMGEPKWVDRVIEQSIVPELNYTHMTADGFIKCQSFGEVVFELSKKLEPEFN